MPPAPRAVAFAVAAVIGVIVVAAGCRQASAQSGVACFETPEWAEPGGLELRADASGEGLLIRHRTTAERLREDYHQGSPVEVHSPRSAVALYDPASGRLDGAVDLLWREAGTEVVDCDRSSAAPVTPFVLDARGRTLRFRDRAIRAAGGNVLMLVAAPGGERVAVLSAAGSAAEAILPFLGRGGAAGTHYHQVFLRDHGTEQGEAVVLPLTSEEVGLSGCWSADGRYMIYADVLYNQLCIVQSQAAGGDRR